MKRLGMWCIAGMALLALGLMGSRQASGQGKNGVMISGPLPLPVTASPAQPFEASETLSLGASGGGFSGEAALYIVPLGKRAVIEYASTVFGSSSGLPIVVGLTTSTASWGGFGTVLPLPLHALTLPAAGGSQISAGHNVKLYADQRSVVRALGLSSGSASGVVSISGYLVDLP
jgi:hypothetical protein